MIFIQFWKNDLLGTITECVCVCARALDLLGTVTVCMCARVRACVCTCAIQVDLKEKIYVGFFFFFEVLLYPEISKTHLKNIFSYMSHFTHHLEIKPSVPHRDIHTPRY